MEAIIMSYIYKISNDINNKVYIGKTNLSIEQRFIEHCKDAQRIDKENRPLYKAMKKYGINHFFIDIIEECSTEEASLREQYWIGFFNSYAVGYNATLGGDGKLQFNHAEIAEHLKKHPYPVDIARQFNCSQDLIYIIANEYHIKTFNKGQNNVQHKRQVFQYDKITKQYIQSFESVALAAEWLKQQQIISTVNSGVRSHIADVANGKRKTAYGFIWKYNNE